MSHIDEPGDPQRLADFLAAPRERLDVELKQWLDLSDGVVRAKVARHLMALANHGGGWLQFGFVEGDDGQFAHELDRTCADEAMYSTDAINALVRRHTQPAFHCEVYWHPCEVCPGPHALIRVPGGHRIPIVCKRGGPDPNPDPRRGATYGRLVGPRSEALEDPDDWHRLLDACLRHRRDELLAAIGGAIGLLGAQQLSNVLAVPAEAGAELRAWEGESKERLDGRLAGLQGASPYEHGSWSFAYRVAPAAAMTQSELRQLMRDVAGTDTGWPPWYWPSAGDVRDPSVVAGAIECWMHTGVGTTDPSHADFWRASTAGRFFLLRGFDEDGAHTNIPPGSFLDPVTAIWRIGECVLHAGRVAERLDCEAVEILVQWSGLAGRHVRSFDRMRYWDGWRIATDDQTETIAEVETAAISATLPSIVRRLTEPLFALFGFLEIPEELIATELDRMRGRRQD